MKDIIKTMNEINEKIYGVPYMEEDTHEAMLCRTCGDIHSIDTKVCPREDEINGVGSEKVASED